MSQMVGEGFFTFYAKEHGLYIFIYLCTTDRAKVMTSNTKGLEKVMTEADENFNQATVDLSQCLNQNVAFDYYIWNYNGSVEKKIYIIYQYFVKFYAASAANPNILFTIS